jgi:DNA polymerase I-like protein with 3'-5' exonuclease and polymerase domains
VIHTVDFETEAIGPYPDYPPKPVGVSIWRSDKAEPEYLAWGHPSENNCTFVQARQALASVWDQPVLFHNGRFDIAVAEKWMALPWPKEHLEVHDTLFLLFLANPHAPSLSLKPSAKRLLGIEPEEQDALRLHLAGMGIRGKDWAAHISKAPGELVGKYANGDVFRTRRLFEHLLPEINKLGMTAAYRREQKLAPILNAAERDGIRIDHSRLAEDTEFFEGIYKEVGDRIFPRIGEVNLDSAQELATGLIRAGFAKESDFAKTPTGQFSTTRDSMGAAVKDKPLLDLIGYRRNLRTVLTTFMRPWLTMADANAGRLHPQFNQVRGDEYGTRTGRLSSSNPNFQNIPKEFDIELPPGLPPLPLMRRYILPDVGCEIAAADFNGQEMRIAAHFAEGRAMEIYRDDPRADFHQAVSNVIRAEMGVLLPRKTVKAIGFSLIYGAGLSKLAAQLGVDYGTATRIREQYFTVLPGFQSLMRAVSKRGRDGQGVKTWGGRRIFCELPKEVNGRMMTFEYKLLNHLIQGSAADQTKESIIRSGYKSTNLRFMGTVHDENVYSIDPSRREDALEEIRSAMEDQSGWDVPFRIEVKTGKNWAEMEAVKLEKEIA